MLSINYDLVIVQRETLVAQNIRADTDTCGIQSAAENHLHRLLNFYIDLFNAFVQYSAE